MKKIKHLIFFMLFIIFQIIICHVLFSPVLADKTNTADNEKYYINNIEEAIKLYKAEKFDRAIEIFKNIIVKNPKYDVAYYNLGVTYLKTQDWKNATNSFFIFLEFDPNNESARKGINKSGTELIKQAKARLAEPGTEQIPQYKADLYNQLGMAYLGIGDNKKAKAEILRAISIKNNFAEAHLNIAIYYLREYDRTKAIESIKKAYKFNPENFLIKLYHQKLTGSENLFALDTFQNSTNMIPYDDGAAAGSKTIQKSRSRTDYKEIISKEIKKIWGKLQELDFINKIGIKNIIAGVAAIIIIIAVISVSNKMYKARQEKLEKEKLAAEYESLKQAVGCLTAKPPKYDLAAKHIENFDVFKTKDKKLIEDVYLLKTIIHLNLKNEEQSKIALDRLLNENPKSLSGKYISGYYSIKSGKLDDALTTFKSIIDVKKEFFRVPEYVGLVLYKKCVKYLLDNKLNEAFACMAEFEKFYGDKKKFPEIKNIEILKFNKAVEDMKTTANNDEPMEKFKNLLKLPDKNENKNSISLWSHVMIGILLFKSKKYDLSLKEFEAAEKFAGKCEAKSSAHHPGKQSIVEILKEMNAAETSSDGNKNNILKEIIFMEAYNKLLIVKDNGCTKKEADDIKGTLQKCLNADNNFIEALLIYAFLIFNDDKKEGTAILKKLYFLGLEYPEITELIKYQKNAERSILLNKYSSEKVSEREINILKNKIVNSSNLINSFGSLRFETKINTDLENKPTTMSQVRRRYDILNYKMAKTMANDKDFKLKTKNIDEKYSDLSRSIKTLETSEIQTIKDLGKMLFES